MRLKTLPCFRAVLLGSSILSACACSVPPAHAAGQGDAAAVRTRGTVDIGGKQWPYEAEAGTVSVSVSVSARGDGHAADPSRAIMSYVAYRFKGDAGPRPLVFITNGGPGASTMWLHIGAFGPRRLPVAVGASGSASTPLVNNQASLLDAADLVFVDSPGTGYGRLEGAGASKAFNGIDGDARALAGFVEAFQRSHGAGTAPIYLMGESYGALRSVVAANELARDGVQVRGLLLLSPILSYSQSFNLNDVNPGLDAPYEHALPSFAAIGLYHHRVKLEPGQNESGFLDDAERFANGEYASALAAGDMLSAARREQVAARYAAYTGLPLQYVLDANLRVTSGGFAKQLLKGQGLLVSRLDGRFTGRSTDGHAKDAEYDPVSTGWTDAFVGAYQRYSLSTLHYGEGATYAPDANLSLADWNWNHKPVGLAFSVPWIVNVLPDLVQALTRQPRMRVLVAAGAFDLATPYGETWFEMHHLNAPTSVTERIQYRRFASGHQIYFDAKALGELHAWVARVVGR